MKKTALLCVLVLTISGCHCCTDKNKHEISTEEITVEAVPVEIGAEQVKIFLCGNDCFAPQDLEKQINVWLAKNQSSIEVTRVQTNGRGYPIVLIFYKKIK